MLRDENKEVDKSIYSQKLNLKIVLEVTTSLEGCTSCLLI